MPRYAAIDIGSNSVRMQAAEVVPGSPPRILANERQVTRLGESVFRSGRIGQDTIDFTCQVLAGMAEIYRKLDVVGVRAVATSAVRDASNQIQFLELASQAIRSPVEIISGQEEARLIHLGVQTRWPHPTQRLLLVDVGGGSAEFMLSEKGRMLEAFSKPLGALRLTETFLKHDPPQGIELRQMQEYIDERLAAPLRRIGPGSFDRVIATSATAAAVVCAVNRVPRSDRETADRLRASARQIRKFYKEIGQLDLGRRRKISGIGPRRAEIIIPGAALLSRVLETFQAASLLYSLAGVRDGIIADLAARGVGRELSHLSREQRRVVEQAAQHYGVSLQHARKVAELSHVLFESLQTLHELPPHYGKLLEAAAYLHDIGHYVSDMRHHKHSYYLVENSDMPGFTDPERQLIAHLCRYHRKSLPTPLHDNYQALNAEEKRAILLLAPLLRIADSLDRSHDQRIERMDCQIRDGRVVLTLRSPMNVDLDQWAGERAAEVFRRIYNCEVTMTRVRRETGGG
jgi:exopolyphosphatase/guanosine-5'-triphosphate,3'-diphosphate pyrophosphatase